MDKGWHGEGEYKYTCLWPNVCSFANENIELGENF